MAAPSVTLAETFNPRRNSLGFLRFFLAALVIVDHAFPLGGFYGGTDPMWGWTRNQESLGGLAVGGFFVISGYLITKSFITAPSVGNFLWRRFLRIFPGFWVCLAVTAFVFGPIAWHHQIGPLHGYLHHRQDSPVSYLSHNAFLRIRQWNIDGLLMTTPYVRSGYPMAFDGSLWTLIYEFHCYLAVGVLGIFGVLQRAKSVVLGLGVFLWMVTIVNTMVPGSAARAASIFKDYQYVRLPLFFVVGALLYLYADRIVVADRLALLAAIGLVVSLRTNTYGPIGPPAIGYLCFWLAIRLPLHWFDRRGDFSYGVYIYAFPVQQLLSLYGFYRYGIVAYVIVATIGTTVLAVASWFLVEGPALRLKTLRMKSLWPARLRLRPNGNGPTGAHTARALRSRAAPSPAVIVGGVPTSPDAGVAGDALGGAVPVRTE